MSEAFIQLPVDDVGKRQRTIAKTVGGVEVHSPYKVIGSTRILHGAYIYQSPQLAGSTTAGYVYFAFFYPATATRLLAVRRIQLNVKTVATAVWIPLTVYRITASSAGTARPVGDVCKKDTTYPDPVIDIRDTGPNVTLAQRMFSVISPGAAAENVTGVVVWDSKREDRRDDLILRPGEGICLRQEAAGDADQRYSWAIDWEEFGGVPVGV